MQTPSIRRAAMRSAVVIALAGAALVGCAPTTQAGTDEVPPPADTQDTLPEASVAETTTDTASETTESSAPSESASPTATTESNVTVAVVGLSATAPDAIEVRSFVTDYVGDGTCTIVATAADGTKVEQSVAALPDAKSTTCPTTVVSGLNAGSYSVVVKFDAGERFGESQPQTIEVGQ